MSAQTEIDICYIFVRSVFKKTSHHNQQNQLSRTLLDIDKRIEDDEKIKRATMP